MVMGATGASAGQVVSVTGSADGSATVILRTPGGQLKTLPASAFAVRQGKLATTWTDAQINAAPAAQAPAQTPPAEPDAPPEPPATQPDGQRQ